MAQLLKDLETGHCGIIHDAQLDYYGQCLATASADGSIRLWDVRDPEEPRFLCELGDHAGAVYQVSWAPPGTATLLASVASDGQIVVWGRRSKPDQWHAVHRQDLRKRGSVRAVAWAPAEHGHALACASADGSISVLQHTGAVWTDTAGPEHRWSCQSFQAHKGQANAVSWGSPEQTMPGGGISLSGARLASAGDDGVKVWFWSDERKAWEAETSQASKDPQDIARDVAWKPCEDTLASAARQAVFIWQLEATADSADRSWRMVQEVPIGEEVWKISWSDIGGMLLVSCGEDQRSLLLKQQLGGEWDAMDLERRGD